MLCSYHFHMSGSIHVNSNFIQYYVHRLQCDAIALPNFWWLLTCAERDALNFSRNLSEGCRSVFKFSSDILARIGKQPFLAFAERSDDETVYLEAASLTSKCFHRRRMQRYQILKATILLVIQDIFHNIPCMLCSLPPAVSVLSTLST